MNISLMCIALLAILTIILGVAVTVLRGKSAVLIGSSLDPEDTLHKYVRAHGNTAEYTAAFMVLIYILGQYDMPSWVIWFVVLLTFCRYLLVIGMIIPKTMNKPNPMRFIGAIGSYIFGLGLCFALLQRAINA